MTSTPGSVTAPILLEARDLSVGYGTNPVVRDLNFTVAAGEIVGLMGANGAGKTTTLLGFAGELKALRGSVWLAGVEVTSPLHKRAKQGLGFVTEEKSVIFRLSVLDNLRLGRGDIELAFDLFPELKPLRKQSAGTLSGGEQQILTFARALSRSPKILMADELSNGLAPLVVERLSQVIQDASLNGVGVVLVEQHIRTVLALSHRAYVLKQGQIVLEGTAAELEGRIDEIVTGYLSE